MGQMGQMDGIFPISFNAFSNFRHGLLLSLRGILQASVLYLDSRILMVQHINDYHIVRLQDVDASPCDASPRAFYRILPYHIHLKLVSGIFGPRKGQMMV